MTFDGLENEFICSYLTHECGFENNKINIECIVLFLITQNMNRNI